MTTFTFKRGDTFLLTCYYKVNGVAAALPAQITSQLRTPVDVLVADLVVTRVDEAGGIYTLSALPSATQSWVPRTLNCDIQYIDASGNINSTETFQVNVEADVTHA